MDINPEDEISYTTQYQETFRQYEENEYYPKHRQIPDNTPGSIPSSNPLPSIMASKSDQSSVDSDD
jgi:hypothetical protein